MSVRSDCVREESQSPRETESGCGLLSGNQ